MHVNEALTGTDYKPGLLTSLQPGKMLCLHCDPGVKQLLNFADRVPSVRDVSLGVLSRLFSLCPTGPEATASIWSFLFQVRIVFCM